MNLLKSQRNHLDKITVKIFNYLHAHRSNKKKKFKWRDLDYLFNGIRVLLVCSLNISEAAQDPKHTRRKYEKERRKDLRPQTPDPSGTFFIIINIFILLKTVGGSILVKINIKH